MFVLDSIQFNPDVEFKSISVLLILNFLESCKILQISIDSLYYFSIMP